MKKIPKKDQEILNQILRCAFLCAVGDKELADEELDDLQGGIQGMLQGLYHYRKAIELFEETKDFEASLKLKGPQPVITINASIFGGLPPFLDDVYEQRGAVKDIDELIGLEKLEASKITDLFFKKLAVVICDAVCERDGHVSQGELVSINNMCEIWDLDYDNVLEWKSNIIYPILSEEKPEDLNESLNLQDEMSEILSVDIDDPGDEADNKTINKNAENLLPVHAKTNGFKQSMACIYCCAFGSGDFSQDESDILSAATNNMSELYFWSEDEDSPLDLAIESADEVLDGFLGMDSYELGDTLSNKSMIKNITKISKKITDPHLQHMILYLGRAVAESDGLDTDEESVIESLRASWGHEWKEIDETFNKS